MYILVNRRRISQYYSLVIWDKTIKSFGQKKQVGGKMNTRKRESDKKFYNYRVSTNIRINIFQSY